MAVENVELRYEGGVLQAAVYWPADEGPHPGVVIAPGGLEKGNIDAYRWAGERLELAGYAAMITTYRAASPYSDADDMGLAIDWLAKNARVDERRIAVWGHSRGGLGALLCGARDDRVRAAISTCAPSDLPDYMGRLSTYFPAARDGIARFLGGTSEEVPEQYASIHLLGLAGKLTKPVLLLHGTADMRVPVDQSVRLATALKDGGNENVRLELLPGVGHYFELGTTGYQFDGVMELTASWLDSVLT